MMPKKAISINEPADIVENHYQYKTIGNYKIAYRDIGKGHTVFTLPSWPIFSVEYTPLASALRENVRMICLDIPGWMGMSKGNSIADIDELKNLIKEFILSFNTNDFSIMGYSIGGILALDLINEVKPKKIILISSSYSGNLLVKRYKNALLLYKFLGQRVSNKFLSSIIKFIFKLNWSHKDFYLRYGDLLNQLLNELDKVDLKSAINLLISTSKKDMSIIKNLSIDAYNLFVVYADNDPEYVKIGSKTIVKELGAQKFVVRKADHNHLAFEVNKSAEKILNFLNNK